MSAAPFMQLYVADYLGDTQHLSCEQHGAYLLLLMTMWRADGTLQNDPVKLARIVRMSQAKWTKIADDVLAFFDIDGDQITQKRLAAEIKKSKEKSEVRAAAGASGGKAKSLKNNDQPVAIATVLPKHSSEARYQKEEIAAAQLSGRAKYEAIESQLREAAGWQNEANPNLMVVGPILSLIEGGADLERDILPTIKAKAAPLRRPPGGGWAYFVPIIIEAREKRLGIAAKVAPAPVVAVTAEAWAARLGLYRKAGSWDREKWGPPPAEPGCEVPPELLPTPTEWPPAATATAA